MAVTTVLSPAILQKVWGVRLEMDRYFSESPNIYETSVERGVPTVRLPRYYTTGAQMVPLDQILNPIGSEAKIPRIRTEFGYVDMELERFASSSPLDKDLEFLIKNPGYFPADMQERVLMELKRAVYLGAENRTAARLQTVANWTVGGQVYSEAATANPWTNNANDPFSLVNAGGLLHALTNCYNNMNRPNMVWFSQLSWWALINNTTAQGVLFPFAPGTIGGLPDINLETVSTHLSNMMGWQINCGIISARYTGKPAVPAEVVPAAANVTDAWADCVIIGETTKVPGGINDTFVRVKGGEFTDVQEVTDELTTLVRYWETKSIFTAHYGFGRFIYGTRV
jgi:hypothetical protein